MEVVMKKNIICLFIIFILTIHIGFASQNNLSPINENHAFNVLINCKLIDELIEESKENYVSRRNALYLISAIQINGIMEIDSESYFKQEKIEFIDVDLGTNDSKLVATTHMNGILKGRCDTNGNLVADLDSYITYKESITILLRMFEMGNLFLSSKGDDWFSAFDGWGLIPSISNEFQLKHEQENQYIETGDFLYLVYDILHTPFQSYQYGGVLTKRYIDQYVGEIIEENPYGKFPNYKN